MPKIFDWPFLNEPIYRWFMFLVAIMLFFITWRFILDHVKGA